MGTVESKAIKSSRTSCICKPTSEATSIMLGEKKLKRKGKKVSNGSGDNDISTMFQALSIDTATNEILVEDKVPKNVLYYGWFFNNEVSLLIKEIAYVYLNECLDNVHQFQRFLRDACKLHEISDPLEFYRRPRKTKPSEELEYHITSKFFPDRKPSLEYASMVHPFIGKVFRIHIVGLYFTPKSFGVRVKLTDAQKNMFDEREGTTDRIGSSKTPIESELNPSNAKTFQKALDDELASYKSILKTKDPKCQSRLHSRFAKMGVGLEARDPEDFQPTTSRAHITIGCAPHVKAVQTGIDLLDIVDLEHRAQSSSSVFHQDYQIDGGTLRQFGRFGDAFVIYPCHEIIAEATFNVFV